MLVRVPQVRPSIVLLVVGLVAVAIAWAKVAQTLFDATPPPSAAGRSPGAIVWGNKVVTRHELAVWLRSRGATYEAWRRNHPAEAALLEHRPQQPSRPQPAATPARPATASLAASDRRHGWSPGGIVLGLLFGLAVALAAAAATPDRVIGRFPTLARAVGPHREVLLSSAAALMIGTLVGAVIG